MSGANWSDGDDEVLAAELEDDVVGSGIFDEPGRRPTANPDMGVLASRFGIPGYLARERPFEVSEDIIAASGARFVPVPAGGMSYVSPASVGPHMYPEEAEGAPGIRRTYRRSATLPKASIVEPLGEDAVALRPARAAMDSCYYVPEQGGKTTGLVTTREGQTRLMSLRGSDKDKKEHLDHGRRVAARVYEEAVRRGLAVGQGGQHPVWGVSRTPGEKPPWAGPKDEGPDDAQIDVPADELVEPTRPIRYPLTPLPLRPLTPTLPELRSPISRLPITRYPVYTPPVIQRSPAPPSNVSVSGIPAFYLRPGMQPVQVGMRGLGVEPEAAPMGLGGWLVTGLVLGIAGSILYQTVK